ncbi:MAG TPA: aliphatic sulfonate ABC transporter substrate-binding protein [Negativicutes bacterium]|jgi:sulfonate transport system substrate-binding protein
MKKYLLLTVIFVAMIALLTGCGAEQKKATSTTLKVGYVDVGKSFPGELLGIAVEKGYIEEELKKVGVKPEFIPFVGAGPAINEGLGSKNLDIGIFGDTPAILAKGSGMETTLIAASNTAVDAGIVVLPDSNISSIKDLQGKKIATMKGAYMHRSFVEALKANGMTIKDVEFFHMKAPEAETALISKNVDAIVAPDTSTARLAVSKQGKVVIDCQGHPEWMGLNIVVARTEFAKENPEAVIAFLKGLLRAKQYADANPEEAKTIWTKVGFSKEIYDYLYPQNKFSMPVELTADTAKVINNNKEFLKENGILKSDVDIEKWIDRSYYEKAKNN